MVLKIESDELVHIWTCLYVGSIII